MRRAVPGEKDAEFLAFVTMSRRELRQVAFLMCGDWHQAEDLTQDALLSLYAAWDRIEVRSRLLPYARRVLLRKLLDQRRRPWRREVATSVPDREDVRAGTHDLGERRMLLDLLANLAPRRRACLVLRYFEELSVAETAEVLGCSEGTVKSQTSRALAELRALVDDAGLAIDDLLQGVS
ncbi:SigE family RNA polymerase sigma factor [Humibacillus xanthopallidus]|uniref:SigE family RNA polymerase sigma factor n=1 Tax=Humibacillus xanthopallidus TaxID=412689 RepID=UPI001C8A9DEB|nr:SigE family RNA polymerase sigma factor [Humibacillus xanthopallidus]